uniref:MULE transposase domain-containing protein n=1 Tax=Lactuca sativa TaxID=4236 RepID=A0A9R1X175_LACSA|nr:hypothetical protein LSAT_V11C700369240 [Lactuca sativa]
MKFLDAKIGLLHGDIPGVQQNEHAQLDEDDEDIGVEYRVHDPNVDWKETRLRLGDCYQSPDQLRFYVVFKAFRDGWNRGCRRVIGLDGSFLKGRKVKGEILTAIGRDEDNHVYPIAWAVMNVENKDNWTWFIENLVADLDLGAGNGLVVISDQHKGLLQAMADLLPHVEHRKCARHIFANFRKKFTGLELNNLFWEAAMSTVAGDFLATMDKIKKITETGYTYLMARKSETWCRAFFSHGYACEAVENRAAECFNDMIKEIRKKPLLTMLEEISILLMKRFFHQGQEEAKWRGNCGPNIQLKIDEFGKDMSQAAINYIHKDPSQFLSFWFHKDKYVATYNQNIQPIGGSILWSMTDIIKPLPPLVRRMPGRPKLKRVKYASESQDAKYPSQRLKVPRTMRRDATLPPVSEIGDQDGGPAVNERVNLKDLSLSGYTRADAVAAMKEVYGEVKETHVDERDVQKRDVQEKEIEEREVEEEQVEEREVEEEEACDNPKISIRQSQSIQLNFKFIGLQKSWKLHHKEFTAAN